jgi:hypothetical protein
LRQAKKNPNRFVNRGQAEQTVTRRTFKLLKHVSWDLTKGTHDRTWPQPAVAKPSQGPSNEWEEGKKRNGMPPWLASC